MNFPKRLLLILLSVTFLGLARAENATVRVRVQLIAADQAAGSSDTALSALLPKLNRMPYKRFRQVGNTSVTLTQGSTSTAGLGNGHSMRLQLVGVENARARMQVNWSKSGQSVVSITVVTGAGAPFVLGGPQDGGVTYIAVFSIL